MAPHSDERCPFDARMPRSRCTYRERCPYYVRGGEGILCLGTAPYDNYLGHMVGASVLLSGPPAGGDR